MYKITISQFTPDAGDHFEIYAQSVENLSIRAVIDAINSALEPVKQKKVRRDKGLPRKKDQTTAGLEGK